MTNLHPALSGFNFPQVVDILSQPFEIALDIYVFLEKIHNLL